MFRLKDSGLPKDPVFPHDLRGLGYFVNSQDEIRNIERPNEYFKFFLTKNDRYNVVHREAMNAAIRSIIKERLHALDLETVRLPFGSKANEPHVPIFISKDIHKHSRIIILFYEHNQDLGVFAHRIIGGQGGINEGSAVNFIKYINSLPSSKTNSQSPGIILANLGQLRWWRRGNQAVSQSTWYALPQKSAVHQSPRFDSVKNTVPENRDVAEHVNYVLTHVVDKLLCPTAKLDIIGVSDGAVKVVDFFNNEQNFKTLSHRLDAIALLAPFHQKEHLTYLPFRTWLQERGRAYTVSEKLAGIPIGDGEGSNRVRGFGCNTYSLGEPYYSELLLPKGYKRVVDYFLEVANESDYCNPKILISEPEDHSEDESSWASNKASDNKDDEQVEPKTKVLDTKGISDTSEVHASAAMANAASLTKGLGNIVHDVTDVFKNISFEAGNGCDR